MKMFVWPATAAMIFAIAMSAAYADESNYPTQTDSSYSPPVATHMPHPSSAAVARKTMKQADRKLARDVRKAIAKGGNVDMARLNVVAHSGKVTLLGSVPETDQIDVATQRAQSVAGVTDVANKLGIDVPGGH